ncbi:MAG: ribosome biogenesis GTP-binding protein YihA/YsxC [Chitinophagales bacterium]|nr:ribosome biogenesis GTP-binding protein YihA/YsxC [Chitinophagales bacterium]
MEIKTAEYVGSFVQLAQCPQTRQPEFAFIGRSNVGKSSLVNYLCGRKALAKVSVTPGKTQTLNYFNINQHWFLVDLPGYGYAKTSRTTRAQWSDMIRNFVLKRETLQYVFILIDSRIAPQKIDVEFINWMGEKGIPFCIAFTKADKLSSPDTQSNIASFKNKLLESWEELPPMFVTSSEKKTGKEPILNFIHEALNLR